MPVIPDEAQRRPGIQRLEATAFLDSGFRRNDGVDISKAVFLCVLCGKTPLSEKHMTTLYGIKNCDSVRKARQWLAANDIPYTFHDLRADGLDEATLHNWAGSVGWETLLNRRGTTWRKLPEEQRNGINEQKAIQWMLENPTLIKRPVLVSDDTQTHVGFKPADYESIFQQG